MFTYNVIQVKRSLLKNIKKFPNFSKVTGLHRIGNTGNQKRFPTSYNCSCYLASGMLAEIVDKNMFFASSLSFVGLTIRATSDMAGCGANRDGYYLIKDDCANKKGQSKVIVRQSINAVLNIFAVTLNKLSN